MRYLEFRKLIKFGNSSYIISIPGKWLKKNKLNKGDVINLYEDKDNRLILSAGAIQAKEEKEFLIETEKKDLDRIKAELYKAYTDGFDVIKLKGNNLNNNSEEIRSILNNFVAVEIIEQTSDKLIAKNLLNTEDVNINDVIRRIDIIIRSMITDSSKCIDTKDCSPILKRDLDVNRLCFMLERILKNALNDPNISKKIDMQGVDLLHLWYIVTNLEAIGDEVKRIARFLTIVKFNSSQKEEFLELYFEIEESYLDVINSFYKKDKELAFEVSLRKENLHEKCSKFLERNSTSQIGGMVEKMKALVSWIKTIALFSYD